MDVLKIYHFMGSFPWKKGTLVKFQCINRNMPKGGGRQVKIDHIFNDRGSQGARSEVLLIQGSSVQILQNILRN
jgi:hypothetical protein